MTNPFDADELFKRSIFSSILGFGRKSKNTGYRPAVDDFLPNLMERAAPTTFEEANPPVAAITNSVSIFNDSTAQQCKYRTKQEIYNEIVCECAEIEKKAASLPKTVETRSVACSTSESTDNSFNMDPNSVEGKANIKAIENLVRLVVTAVKESGVLSDHSSGNSPEDILRRKRQQNNVAAARYRKRQKELREEAEMELTILTNKNNELKDEIKRMQAEIEQLKARVLKRTSYKP